MGVLKMDFGCDVGFFLQRTERQGGEGSMGVGGARVREERK